MVLLLREEKDSRMFVIILNETASGNRKKLRQLINKKSFLTSNESMSKVLLFGIGKETQSQLNNFIFQTP